MDLILNISLIIIIKLYNNKMNYLKICKKYYNIFVLYN